MGECEGLGMGSLEEGESNACHSDPTTKCAIMGISFVVSQIEGAAVLVHGPKGCAFPVYEVTQIHPLAFNFSEMCEKVVIFGGEKLLGEKIVETWHDNDAEFIAVISTCSSEIIGDDIAGIIAESDLPIPVLSFEGAGFKRTHWQAIDHAMAVILGHYAKKTGERERDGSINLICPVGASARWIDEAYAIESLLKRLGRPVRRLFCANRPEDFAAAGRADLTVLASPDLGVEGAELLKRRFGIPFIAPGLPIGLENTIDFLAKTAAALGEPCDKDALAQEADGIRRRFRKGMGRVITFRALDGLHKLPIAVVAEPAAALAYAKFLACELESMPGLVVVKSADEADCEPIRRLAPRARILATDDNMVIRDALGSFQPQVLLSGDIELLLCGGERPAYVDIGYPGARILHLSPRPYGGFEGCLNLLEDLFNRIVERFH